ncbi:3-oxoacyl-[acyl-carrier-protein] reductase FabG [Fusarium oxysporum f. sp. albedinis]|nr:3-oxoacyl-[acyl-carrier-protein] reductase FabG [Fusarium oxysporum f. sp. albedinis]
MTAQARILNPSSFTHSPMSVSILPLIKIMCGEVDKGGDAVALWRSPAKPITYQSYTTNQSELNGIRQFLPL